MTRIVPRPLSAIVEEIPDGASVLVLGCGDCARREGFGGERECQQTVARLREAEVPVVGWAAPEAGKSMCNPQVLRGVLREAEEMVSAADALVLLACTQAEPGLERETDLPIIPGVQVIVGGVTGGGYDTVEECDFCDVCIARVTGGLCPHAFCPKGLMNGPCGGAQGGRCEVLPDRPCVWELIHRRLRQAGRLELLRRYQSPVSFELSSDGEQRHR